MAETVPYEVAEQLRTPEEMAAYLDAWRGEAPDDPAGIARALSDVARANHVTQNTAMTDLLQDLQRLESELHHPGVRCSRQRLEQMLHPDFHEVGRSGLAYTRDTVIGHLAALDTHPTVEPSNYAVALLAEGCALLTYRSAHRAADGSLSMHTHRSSLWLRVGGHWQLRYHQGTPTTAAA